MIPEAFPLARLAAGIERAWDPRLLARANGQDLRLARLEGDFVWHAHAEEDEVFLCLAGELAIEFRERPELGEASPVRAVPLAPGELLVVPRGVPHRPVAPEGASVLLFEPSSTVSTGEVDDPRRVDRPRPL